MYYILDVDKEVIQCSHEEWVNNFDDFEKNKRIAKDEVNGVTISTVFLWLDHGFWKSDVPIVFETLVFPEEEYNIMYRSSTYKEALAMHWRAFMEVKQSFNS